MLESTMLVRLRSSVPISAPNLSCPASLLSYISTVTGLLSRFPLVKCECSQIEPLQFDSMVSYAKHPQRESCCVGVLAHLDC